MGGLAAPTLADIDDDADLEVIINTAYGGVAAYDLPGTAMVKIHWGTGRGSYYRNGLAAEIFHYPADLDHDRDVDGKDLVSFVNGRTGLAWKALFQPSGMKIVSNKFTGNFSSLKRHGNIAAPEAETLGQFACVHTAEISSGMGQVGAVHIPVPIEVAGTHHAIAARFS